MLTGHWKARPQNMMAETRYQRLAATYQLRNYHPRASLRMRWKRKRLILFQQAFGIFLDDTYVEKVIHELGVWEPIGAWYSGLNVKELACLYRKSRSIHITNGNLP